MFPVLLRALDIVLLALLAAAAGLAALQQRRREPLSTWIVLTVLGLSSFLSCSYAVFDAYQMTLEPTTVSIRTTGVALSGEAKFGVYWDMTGTRAVKEIAWGTLKPGQIGNSTFYVRNEAISDIYCAVTWTEGSWQPANASQYFTLTWDFGELPLKPNRARKVKLQLHVSPNIQDIEDFNFDIVIQGQSEPFTG